jgi:hypothetical protein
MGGSVCSSTSDCGTIAFTMNDRARKIPRECCACGKVLDRTDMERFLDTCEKHGKDPVEVAFSRRPPGCLCMACVTLILAERADDGEPGAQRFITALRNLYHYGVAELPDGKPPVLQ